MEQKDKEKRRRRTKGGGGYWLVGKQKGEGCERTEIYKKNSNEKVNDRAP